MKQKTNNSTNKTQGSSATMGTLFKRILPIIIGLVLILAIGIIMTVSSNAKKKNPTLTKGDEMYLKYDKLTVTNQQLYEKMKKDYGLSELTRLIDENLFAEEVKKVDVNSESYIEYVKDSLFEDEDDPKVLDEQWDSFVESLAVNGVITPAQAEDSKGKREDLQCAAWIAIKDSYKLQYAKNEWAKAEYLKELLEKKKADGKTDLFTEDEIKDEYNDNLTTDITGFFIPFTSADAAKDLMKEMGINVDALADIKKRWVRGEYEYDSKDDTKKNPLPNDYLTDAEVVELCIKMYNYVLAYYNNGAEVIPSDALTTTFNTKKTLELIEEQLTAQMALHKTIKGNVELPLTARIKGLDKTATISWKIVDNDGKEVTTVDENFKLVLEGDKLTLQVVTLDAAKEYKIKATLTLDEEVIGKEDSDKDTIYTIKVAAKSTETDEIPETIVISLPEMNQVCDWEVKGLNNDLGNKHATFIWKSDDDSTMGKYMNSTLKLADFNDSYITSPATVGKYTCLAIKLSETEKVEFDKLTAEEKAKATEETKATLTEALYTGDNAKQLDRLYYEKRSNAGLTIYDNYMDAVYKYGYESCYSSLKIEDYKEYKLTKKTNKHIVAKFNDVEITADDLFTSLEEKYGSTSALTFINQYLVLKDNTQYNPWTGAIDKKYVKNAIKADIAPYEYYFVNDYFNGIYGYYYFGITPAFSAKYGWDNFIKDLYGVEEEKDLLIASNIFNTSGRIYNNALQDYLNKILKYSDMEKIMNEKWDKHYKVDVMNFLIYVDYDLDGNPDTAMVASNAEDVTEENWTESQKALALELAQLVMERSGEADTDAKDKAAELKAVAELYNNATYQIVEPKVNENGEVEELALKDCFGKFKQAGLFVKFEDVATYDQNDSLVDEFHNEMKKLWDYGKENNYIETPNEEPVNYSTVSEGNYAFETSFGYHAVAVKNFYEPTGLPTELEIKLYRTMGKIDAARENIKNATEYAENYQQLESMAASYKAQIKLSEQILETELQNLKTYLNEAGKTDVDPATYTLDASIKEKCETWYENDDETLPVQEYISTVIAIDLVNTLIKTSSTIESTQLDPAQFNYYLNFLLKQYQDKEE